MTRTTRPRRPPIATCLTLGALAAAAPAAQGQRSAPEPAEAAGAAPAPAAEGTAPSETQSGVPALPYTLEIAPTGEEGLDALLAGASQLARLRETAPTSPEGLVARARGDLPRLDAALRSEGYYAARIRITIAGRPLDTPGLIDALENATGPVPVNVSIEPGPRYRIGRVALRAPDAAGDAALATAAGAEPFGLAPGDPATAAAVLDAEAALLDRLRRLGHPLAARAGREVVVDHDTRRMDVALTLAPGPRARFAPPEVIGQERTDTALLRRVTGRLAGEDYTPARLERIRRDLLALGVFDSVRATQADRLDAQGRLPVTFIVSERPLHAIGFSLAYETNYGASGRVYWEHRNLWGGAERLRLEAEVSRLGMSGDTGDLGYRAGGSLRFPWVFGQDMGLTIDAWALRERLNAYDRDAITTSAIFDRWITDRLSVQGGVSIEVGQIGRDGQMDPFQLIGLPLGLRWDGTDSLLDPTRGFRASLAVTPYYEFAEGTVFTRVLGVASTYFDLSGEGRSVIALRAALGSVVGASLDEIPLDKRFYAGGGGSVRGFTYQSIGPEDARGRPNGGASLVEGSIEFRQRIWGDVGGVVFLDAGSVGRSEAPDFSDLRLGAGVGVRYHTVIGPIRADIAFPLNREPGGGSYGIYVGLGQAF